MIIVIEIQRLKAERLKLRVQSIWDEYELENNVAQ